MRENQSEARGVRQNRRGPAPDFRCRLINAMINRSSVIDFNRRGKRVPRVSLGISMSYRFVRMLEDNSNNSKAGELTDLFGQFFFSFSFEIGQTEVRKDEILTFEDF